MNNLKTYLFALTFLLSVCLGINAQTNYKPLGKLIDIGSFKLHFYCLGKGNPTTILAAGSGGWTIHLLELQKELAKTTRVCSYDRAGFGWSEAGTMPRTAKQDATELHELLVKSGEKAPFVLVGQSYGGYVSRLYLEMFTNEVAGIALIESGQENQWKNLPVAKRMMEYGIIDLKEKYQNSRNGKVKKEDFKGDFPPELLPIYQEAMMQPKMQEAHLSTLENIETSAQQLGKTKKLGNLPLIVLSAGNSFGAFIPNNEKNRPMLEGLNKGWMELQFDLAALSTNSQHLISAKNTHDIVNENPKLVASVINLLIANIKKP